MYLKLPNFCSNVSECASYMLNRSPTRGNVGRATLIVLLTVNKPKETGIVIFDSPCTSIRKPKHNTLDKRVEADINPLAKTTKIKDTEYLS